MLQFLSETEDTRPFLDRIVEASNAERNSFGFLPKAVYEDFAFQRRLIVATDRCAKELIGYIIFAGAFPSAKVRQTYVAPDWRKRGIGQALIAEVVRRCEGMSYLFIKANVAQDLEGANSFYESMGFVKSVIKEGGKTTGRRIVVRVKELETPNLLTLIASTDQTPKNIIVSPSTRNGTPLFLIDVNVIFDLVKKRLRHKAVRQMIAAAFENEVKLAVSTEFAKELERNSHDSKPDPILEFIRAMPVVTTPSDERIQPIIVELSPKLFPDRTLQRKLSEQDESDLVHLATAVIENVSGFVTSEKAILRHADWFREKYRIDIISPSVFASADDALSPAPKIGISIGKSVITSQEMCDSDFPELEKLAQKLKKGGELLREAFSVGTTRSKRTRMVIRHDGQLIGAGAWQKGTITNPSVKAYLFVDHDSPVANLAIEHMIDMATRTAAETTPSMLELTISRHETLLGQGAINAGFDRVTDPHASEQKFRKICLGCPLTKHNWSEIAELISVRFGLKLPTRSPSFSEPETIVQLNANEHTRVEIPLRSLEDYFSPTLMALNGRNGVIVPITPNYAEALFRGSQQPSLFAGQQAMLLASRCYLSGGKSISRIPEQGLICFYESAGREKSAGRSAAIAIARIRRRYLANEGAASSLAEMKGVLSPAEISVRARGKELCVTEFDNLMQFQNPVELEELKDIGCADGANMVTANSISIEAILKLIERGRPHA